MGSCGAKSARICVYTNSICIREAFRMENVGVPVFNFTYQGQFRPDRINTWMWGEPVAAYIGGEELRKLQNEYRHKMAEQGVKWWKK